MEKIDCKKQLKELYQTSARDISQVDVPALNYLMIDGMGDPNGSPSFAAAIEALFSLSYTIKFMIKKGPLAIDYGVMPLEGLWWADDMSKFTPDDKSAWKWTVMIMQPDFITADHVQAALEMVRKKKPSLPWSDVRFETMNEGRSAQLLHIGPFSAEGPAIERLHQVIHDLGFELTGKHHEIYLSDMSKAKPDKWKTIIRQPMN